MSLLQSLLSLAGQQKPKRQNSQQPMGMPANGAGFLAGLQPAQYKQPQPMGGVASGGVAGLLPPEDLERRPANPITFLRGQGTVGYRKIPNGMPLLENTSSGYTAARLNQPRYQPLEELPYINE